MIGFCGALNDSQWVLFWNFGGGNEYRYPQIRLPKRWKFFNQERGSNPKAQLMYDATEKRRL